jgi:zinc transporter 1
VLQTVRSASFVLLQGVPATISIEQVRAAILAVEGVLGLHELHIWQVRVFVLLSVRWC